MKKSYLYILVIIFATTSGCKKFLEKEPDNRARLDSPQQMAQLVATAYPQGSYMSFAESSSDNVEDHTDGGTPNEIMDPYMFRDVRSTFQDSPEFYWDACYKAIAAANQALAVISQVPADQQSQYSAVKGEALVARAYSHFMLVTFFSKFYNATTAASDPGIPYVTEPENVVIKQYDRKTVKYVYDMVEKDLLAGMPLIRNENYSVPAYHFTKAATSAFAARYYLFKGDYEKVLTYTGQVFPQANVVPLLRPWNTTYQPLTRLELFAVYQKATEPANLLLGETLSSYPRDFATARYSFDVAKARQLIVNVPVLADYDIAEWSFVYQAYGNSNVYIPKINEYFVRESINADIGDIYMMAPLFTTEEVLFNRAEAMTYTGNTAGAIDLLNQYLSTRIDTYQPEIHTLTVSKINNSFQSSNLPLNLLNLILSYKQTEFIHEGMRWFDILRYDIPVSHNVVGGGTLTLPPGDKRRVFQIPQSATLSGIALNPR